MTIILFKIPTGWRQTSRPFTSVGRGFELGATVKQTQVVVRAGLKPATTALPVRCADHSPTLPPGIAQSCLE